MEVARVDSGFEDVVERSTELIIRDIVAEGVEAIVEACLSTVNMLFAKRALFH